MVCRAVGRSFFFQVYFSMEIPHVFGSSFWPLFGHLYTARRGQCRVGAMFDPYALCCSNPCTCSFRAYSHYQSCIIGNCLVCTSFCGDILGMSLIYVHQLTSQSTCVSIASVFLGLRWSLQFSVHMCIYDILDLKCRVHIDNNDSCRKWPYNTICAMSPGTAAFHSLRTAYVGLC